MTDQELKMLEESDLYGLMMAVCGRWLAKYHPATEHAVIVVNEGEGLPLTQVVFSAGADEPTVVDRRDCLP